MGKIRWKRKDKKQRYTNKSVWKNTQKEKEGYFYKNTMLENKRWREDNNKERNKTDQNKFNEKQVNKFKMYNYKQLKKKSIE